MENTIHQQLLDAVDNRGTWEERQRIWYRMRHEGLNRRKKPYPGAANLHYPLIDTLIEKIKPFYFNQAFSMEKIAYFCSLKQQLVGMTRSAEEFFDYVVRNLSNAEMTLLSVIDHMLVSGRSVCKVLLSDKGRLEYEALNPLCLIVPGNARDLESADVFAQVKKYTPASYNREKRYRRDADFVKRITGSSDFADNNEWTQEKNQREGLTYSEDKNEIIVWEVYEKTDEGWTVHTYSPMDQKTTIRAPFNLTTKFQGEVLLPFVDFPMEVKDEGWYSPRGVAERQAPFESWLCKLWNGKADSIDFYNKPLFKNDNAIVNTANVKFLPGEVLPKGIEPVEMPQPPISYDQEMMQTRSTAESELNMPDASLESERNNKEKATAAEVNYRRALATQGVDMRGWLFRKSLAKLWKVSWALLYASAAQKKEFIYFAAEDQKTLPEQALHDSYQIMPDGSPDQWNKDIRYQKAMGRYQTLNGHPNVNQEELVRDVIESDDPRLVKRLHMPTGLQAAKESEDEAMEVLLLMAGYPAVAEPHEDHATRIRILFGKLQQLNVTGAAVDPVARQRLQEHLMQHVMMLQQQNPQAGAQFLSALTEIAQGAEVPEGGSQPQIPQYA